MTFQNLFNLAVLGQIVCISILIPFLAKKKIIQLQKRYPREIYPKLYPISDKTINSTISKLILFNVLAAVIGVFIVAYTLSMSAEAFLNWNTILVHWIYTLIQLSPYVLTILLVMKYLSLMRSQDVKHQRSAQLQARKLKDFVSKNHLLAYGVALLLNIAVLTYVKLGPSEHLINGRMVLYVLSFNLLFIAVIRYMILAKPKDPYQSYVDRMNQIRFSIKVLFLLVILGNLYMTISLLLSVFKLKAFSSIVYSLFMSLYASSYYFLLKFSPQDMSVYQDEKQPKSELG